MFKLAIVQFSVETIFRQQVFMVTLLDDIAIPDHQDPVGIADGGEAVGDDETVGCSLVRRKCLLDL